MTVLKSFTRLEKKRALPDFAQTVWKRGVTDEAPLLKEYEGEKQNHQVNITEPPVA